LNDNTFKLRNGVKIKIITEPYCGWCSKPVSDNYRKCVDCNIQHPLIKIHAAGIYLLKDKKDPASENYCRIYPLNRQIWLLKGSLLGAYKAADNLGECIGYLIGCSYQYLKDFSLIVAAPPSDPNRGFNQAALLAQNISKRISIPFSDELYKKRITPPQRLTPSEQKEENVRDKYGCKRRIDGERVLIIDDICTTRNTCCVD